MRRERPVAVLVVAILNLVFGGVTMVFTLCGCAMLVAIPQFEQAFAQSGADSAFDVYREIPGFWTYVIVYQVVTLLMTPVLLAAGIGLFGMRPWARWANIVYAVFAILLAVVVAILDFAVFIPAVQEWNRQNGVNPADAFFTLLSSFAGDIYTFLLALYGVALLIIMFLPHVRAGFAIPPPAAEPRASTGTAGSS